MLDYSFEHDGDSGRLAVTTHFGDKIVIDCEKEPSQSFRMGATGASNGSPDGLQSIPCNVVAVLADHVKIVINNSIQINTPHWKGPLKAGDRAYVTEYYPVDIEGKTPTIFASKKPVRDASVIFVNLDCLDGGGNIVKRYRVSPFTGAHRVLNDA